MGSPRDDGMIFGSCKASQSPGVPHQTVSILISLTCTLRSDQCLTALGRHNRRRKFPRLYARMNRDSLTRLATNRWHDSRVQFRAYFPSLIHCSADPRPRGSARVPNQSRASRWSRVD